MDIETNELTPEQELPASVTLSIQAQIYLQEAAKWSRFLGIVGFVVCGLFLIMALFIGVIFSVLANLSPVYSQMPAGMGPLFSVVFILIDVLYFFFALYLYQFGKKIKEGLVLLNSDDITIGLGKLKSFFKLAGILTIIFLCIYAIEIVVLIVVGMASIGR